ncbi:ABC transporter substrate-binding protein [Pseudidiomarina homiensis]|uniref:ABC transporter substrate-binding protein n=1 Tax=Pseudidiomarina homiensis TaxID=364198 RepID=UPI00215A631A|nr:ABC transporter substrate-binding protein [Pseudidiomarina homiensis]
MKRIKLLAALLSIVLATLMSSTVSAQDRSQPTSVRFYAWAGSAEVNAYIQWASRELAESHAITLQHVKVADISEAVALVLANSAGESDAVDLLWINGENFAALKDADRLVGGLEDKVPNSRLIRRDLDWHVDFGTAVEGFELPWGIAQLQLIMHTKHVAPAQTVVTPQALLELAKRSPGRFSYPKPPSFHGTSWLKALAFQLTDDPAMLTQPAEPATIDTVLKPLWGYLDRLHPYLWHQGTEFPISAGRQRQLFNQGVLDNSVTFNPNEVRALQLQNKLAPDARSLSIGERALTNFHYLAIPRASRQQQAALEVINFLLSRRAQAHKADPQGWADPSVIRLPQRDLESPDPLVASHPEPHVSWNAVLEQQWLSRYQR